MSKYFSKQKWSYLLYTVTHPMEGYYWIRHQEKGSVPIAVLLVIMFSFSFSFNRMLASFVVNDVDPRSVDSITELGGVVLLFFLFCIGNWSITCLMGGEGRLKDIVIAVGYAMLPLIVCFNIATILSQMIADNEQAYYGIILAIGIGYAMIMVLIGIMQVHNYSLAKTLVTLLFTFIAVFIIIFLILMLYNLISQIYTFFYSIYTEIIFRT